MKTKANAEQTAESLREWIRVQAEFIREQSGKGIHIVEQARESGPRRQVTGLAERQGEQRRL